MLHYLLHLIKQTISSLMTTSNTTSYYDLTRLIKSDVAVFPGDPAFKIDTVKDVKKGDSYTLCHLHLGNHTGTHIDFPAHVLAHGKTSSNYPLHSLAGKGVIVEVTNNKDEL